MIASSNGHLFTSLFFFRFIALSLGLTYWSMPRARDAAGFFVAGRRLTGWQNGLAIFGDYMSAASFWELQASSHSSVVMAFCIRSALSWAGWSSCFWLPSRFAIPENIRCQMSWLSACERGRCAPPQRYLPSRSGCFTCWPGLSEPARSPPCFCRSSPIPPSYWSAF